MVMGENTQIVPIEDMCAAEEEKILCVIRDMVDAQNGGIKHSLNLPASMLVKNVIEEIAKLFNYVADTISVQYEKEPGIDSATVVLEETLDKRFGEICSTELRRHTFNIYQKDGTQPQQQEASGYSFAINSSSSSSTYSGPIQESCSSEYNYSSALMRSETDYVGLVNQAMTCYLNSLVQTLFMTPEFRNAIYRWEFDGIEEEKAKSIPYQLQKLFLLLQTSKRRAVETTDLTQSFGWDSSEVWHQHDVQELCRVMFDALEVKWKNTVQADLINQLYQGKLKDYVKCLECHNESARLDTFLDIPLVIRPFGEEKVYKSVEEALRAFVQPEILDGSNQYFCEKCNKKCNAHKGLKFIKFPYMLLLQLKRFDFDYTTMHRIKLNDKMTFPQVLNVNHLIEESSELSQIQNNTEAPDISSDEKQTEECADEGIDEGIEMENYVSGVSSASDVSSFDSEAAVNDRNARESECTGPYTYELFSIMVHSGSAAGGHYYAYIKSFIDGQWYSFNDQHVSKVTFDDIRKTYGGSPTGRGSYSAAYVSSTNAYMLMYRKIDKENNADFMEPADFLPHLKKHLQHLKDREEADRRQREIDKSTCKIKVFCFHPVQKLRLEQRLEIHKDKTLAEATEVASKMFDLQKVVALDCCRLVKYDEYQDSLERSFENEMDVPMSKLLGGVKQSYSFDLLLETKRPDQVFQDYKPGGVTVKVFVADLDTDTIHDPVSVRAYHTQTVDEFKNLVSQVLNVPNNHMRCVLERFHNDLKMLSAPNKTLKTEGFFKSNKVYIEYSGKEDENTYFKETHLYRLLDRYQNTIRIHVNLPSEEDVEELNKLTAATPTGSGQGDQDSAVGNGVENSTDTSEETGTADSEIDGNDFLDEGIVDKGSDSDIDLKIQSMTVEPSCLTGSTKHQNTIENTLNQPSDHQNSQEVSLCANTERSVECNERTHSCANNSPVTGPAVRHISTNQENSDSTECSPSTNDNSAMDTSQETPNICGESTGTNCVNGEESESANTVLIATGVDSSANNANNAISATGLDTSASNAKSAYVEMSANDAISATGADMSANPAISATGVDTANWQATKQTGATENWNNEIDSASSPQPSTSSSYRTETGDNWEDQHRYFQATPYTSSESSRGLTVFVDKRITLGAFKKELEPYVGTIPDNFKVYRVYSNNQEFENVRLSESLSFLEDGKLNIKLGRALKPGEYRVKVYQLLVNEAEPCKFLIDTIFAKGMSVMDAKNCILPELEQQCSLSVPVNRCRLRKKTWKNPGTIYTDSQVFETDITIFANWEVFLEVLDGPEKMTSVSQLALYVRRWLPSKYQLESFREVLLNQQTVEELKQKLSEISGIAVENVEFAKGRGTFPCDMSVLEVQTDLDWNVQVSTLNVWPLYICDDGNVIFYRDKSEELMEISDDRKKEMQYRENARLSRMNQRTSYSPRKERALKIYTEDPPPSKTSPDLD